MSDAGQLSEPEARYLLGHPLLKLALQDMLDAQIQAIESVNLNETDKLVAIAALIQNRRAFENQLKKHIESNVISKQTAEKF